MNMKKKWEKIKSQIFKVIITINSHHTGAYAAQAAYFFVLSLIPIFLLLLTMVRFTPITMSEVMTAVLKVFPESVAPMIRSIVSKLKFISSSLSSSIFSVRNDRSGYDCCSALVSGERRSVCHIGIKQHL